MKHIDGIKIVSGIKLSCAGSSYLIFTADIPQWHQINKDENTGKIYGYVYHKDLESVLLLMPSIKWYVCLEGNK